MSVIAPACASPASAWTKDIIAGAVAALVTLAQVISLGTLAFLVMGGDAARLGTAAAFISASLSALVYGLLASSRVPVGGPTATATLMVASLLVGLHAETAGLAGAGEARVGWVLAAVAAVVLVQGLLQLAIAAAGVVHLVHKVPQPVLGGFMNAIALLVLLAQSEALLGVPLSQLGSAGAAVFTQLRPGAMLLGGATVGLIVWLNRRRPKWPAALLALVAGTLAYHAVVHGLPGMGMGMGMGMGPTVPHISPELPVMLAWRAVLDGDCQQFLWRNAGLILGTGGALALAGSLESLMLVRAFEQQHGGRSDPRRELAAIGMANVIGSLFGGMPMGMLRSRAGVLMRAGSHSHRAIMVLALASGALYLLGSPLMVWLPMSVLGGVMVLVAWSLVDPWSRMMVLKVVAGERSRELLQSLLVVFCVMAVTVWRGPIFGVGLGIVLALVFFARLLSASLVRMSYSAGQRPSRRIYPPAEEALLAPLRGGIQVLELQGALFFGNAEQLLECSESLSPSTRVLVLDLRRVSTVDETGAHALAQVAANLQRRGQRLLLAQVQGSQPLGQRLRVFGAAGSDGVDWFVDADHAVEAAEQALLARASAQAGAGRSAPALALLEGLNAEELALVRTRLRPVKLAAGEAVFRQGEMADALYLVVSGSIRIVAANAKPATPAPLTDAPRVWGTRYVSLSPGTLFGEAAVLDGGGRTADAVADVASELLRLDKAALAELAQQHPALGSRLYRSLALYLAQRLRVASAAWSAAAG